MIRHRIIVLLSVVVVLGAIFITPFSRINIYEMLSVLYSKKNNAPSKVGLFTEEELLQYNGIDRSELYLSILGNVFDVTVGRKHYGVDGQYRFFIGKDGSRSFISGKFDDETLDKDHVLDLNCDELTVLTNWVDTYKKSYPYKGKLIGRYYDDNGKATDYTKDLKAKLNKCKEESELEKTRNQKLPPCNMEWNVQTGSKVWCSKNSGGVARDWAGVPRQLYTPGSNIPKCVCIRSHQDDLSATLKEYNGCSRSSSSCQIED